ncbi:hypothetical protein E3N88_21342 [Mikania micrantha]|uniref:Uncharacterized protein n=1 Tax=Mikania micrantha TaxID=192012 RepID=A0A5N6NKY2_9ASTR|nr:hypothetical protein E3N88_21342 [Mikania micrantha]
MYPHLGQAPAGAGAGAGATTALSTQTLHPPKSTHPNPPLFSSRCSNFLSSSSSSNLRTLTVNADVTNKPKPSSSFADSDDQPISVVTQENVPLEGVIQFEKPDTTSRFNKWVELSDDVAGGPDETRLGGGDDGVDQAGGDGGLPEMGGPGWEGMVVVDGGGAVVDVGGAGGEIKEAQAVPSAVTEVCMAAHQWFVVVPTRLKQIGSEIGDRHMGFSKRFDLLDVMP